MQQTGADPLGKEGVEATAWPALKGVGGDDAADCLRYLVATKSRSISQGKLRGL